MIEKEKRKHGTNRAASLIILGVMFGGMLLFSTSPVVLAPPLYKLTWLFYVVVLLAWIPVYALLAWRKLIPAQSLAPVMLLGGILWCCTGFLSLKERSFFTFGILTVVECAEQPASEGWVRYDCTKYSEGAVTSTQVIEGWRGFPLLRLVETGAAK
jgi:hypothetical protein